MKSVFACLSVAALLSVGVASGTVAPVAIAHSPAPTLSTTAPQRIAQATARPVARVNPARPVQIRVVNGGDLPIQSVLTQPTSTERPVAAGGTVTFGSTSTSYLPLPIDFLVYPEDSRIGLSVDVFSSNNVVTVVVGQQLTDGPPGRTAMNIDRTGAIYLY